MFAGAAFQGLPVYIRILKWSQVTYRNARRGHYQRDPAGIRREVVMDTDFPSKVTGL